LADNFALAAGLIFFLAFEARLLEVVADLVPRSFAHLAF
jgi:hypothetical protein